MRTFLSFILLSIWITSLASAQDLGYEVSNWYWKQRFDIADQNHNQQLDKNELLALPIEFAYYLSANHFDLSDENHDMQLSFAEMASRKKTEMAFRQLQEKRQIRALLAANQALQTLEVMQLKKQPELMVQLFSNYTWLQENEKIAKELYADSEWLKANPLVAQAFSQNLCWLASCPTEAKKLYDLQKESSPLVSAWRASHLKFIRQNPALETFYQLGDSETMILLGE